MPKKIEEIKKNNPMSLSEKLKRTQMEFNQEQRQLGAKAVTTEVVKQINGWSDGQSSFNSRLGYITGAGAIVGIGSAAYVLYQWFNNGAISWTHLAVPIAIFIVCVLIYIKGQQTNSPKAYFTELKEVEDVWLKGEEK